MEGSLQGRGITPKSTYTQKFQRYTAQAITALMLACLPTCMLSLASPLM